MPHAALLALTLLIPDAQATDWPSLSTPPPQSSEADGARDVALVIAIEDYFRAQDIPGAVDNARAWARWLQQTRGVPVVKVLINEQATREEILHAADGVAERAQTGGRVWVVYIGHGAPSRDGQDGYLVGVDAQQTAMSIEARGVARSELVERLSKGDQEETLLVVDACFSGKTPAGDLAPGLAPLVPTQNILRSKETLLTAARGDQYAGPLSDGQRPAFSYLLLGALRGWADTNQDGLVMASEAIGYAKDAIFQTVTGRVQTPTLDGPDIVLARTGGESPPSLAAAFAAPAPAVPVPDASPAPTPTPAPAVPVPVPVAERAQAIEGEPYESPGLGTMPWIAAAGIWMMEHEVTQAQWEAVMGSPPRGPLCASCPVTNISWYDADAFAQQLSQQEGTPYRLPSESEWLISAAGGQDLPFSGSYEPEAVGWFKTNSLGQPHPVCSLQRNAVGLCDMSGNAWEWTEDPAALRDAIHGGGFADRPDTLDFFLRYRAGFSSPSTGFRLVVGPQTPR